VFVPDTCRDAVRASLDSAGWRTPEVLPLEYFEALRLVVEVASDGY
jgi:hypothetical protein